MNKKLLNIFDLDGKALAALLLLLLAPVGTMFSVESGDGNGSFLGTAPEESSGDEMSEGDVSEVEISGSDDTQRNLTSRRRVGNGMELENFCVTYDVAKDLNSYIQELLNRLPGSEDAICQAIREIQGVSLLRGGRRNQKQTIRVNVTSIRGSLDLYAALERISRDSLGDGDAQQREGRLDRQARRANEKIRRVNAIARYAKVKYRKKAEALAALRLEVAGLRSAAESASRLQTRTAPRDAQFENERASEVVRLRQENAELLLRNNDLGMDIDGLELEAFGQRNRADKLEDQRRFLETQLTEMFDFWQDWSQSLLRQRGNLQGELHDAGLCNGRLNADVVGLREETISMADRIADYEEVGGDHDQIQDTINSLQATLNNSVDQLTRAQGQLTQAEASANWYRNAFYAALALDIIQLTVGGAYEIGKIALRLPRIIRAGLSLGSAGYHTAIEIPGLMRELRKILPQIREALNSEHLDAQKVYEMLQALLDKLKCECPKPPKPWFG